MNIRAIELIHFTSHKHSTLKLPKTGIVLITGENGAGKSSFIEGVSFAGWGKTLRGTVPWKDDAKPPCTAILDTERLRIQRTRDGGKSALSWEDVEASDQDLPGSHSEDPEYDTPTKAQAALLTMLGPFGLWRRSHVFSSADASNFTTASDKERKQLIETFLGNDRFDPAVEACRDDLKAAREKLAALSRTRDVFEANFDGAKQRIADAERQKAQLGDEPTWAGGEEQMAKVQALIDDIDNKTSVLRKNVMDLRNAVRDADRGRSTHLAAVSVAKQMLDRLRADQCPTCAQPITQTMREIEKHKLEKAQTALNAAQSVVTAKSDEVEEALNEAEHQIAHLQTERGTRAGEIAVIKQSMAERTRWVKQVNGAAQTLATALDEKKKCGKRLAVLEEELEVVEQDVAELEAVEVVLGVKGVRATILGKSLGGIEAIANVWLSKFYAKPVRVSLKPYSELKKGGFDDSISFEVDGVGEGLGYKATSGGERRRLDVAMLLAMAEVSAASRGVQAGTLWFDEALDALDGNGVEAVCVALRELAQERCVVVITHSQALIQHLPDAQKVRIAGGQIEV